MDDICFSLIIPVYNVEKFLNKCLESICKQSYSNWEAIIVDDGSTDSSALICDEWANKDNRFKVYHKENGGVCEARNIALSKLTGEYVGFVDADDFLAYNALELVSKAINDTRSDVVFIGHNRVDESNQIKEIRLGEKLILNKKNDIVKQTLLMGKNSYLGVLWNKFIKSVCIYRDNDIIEFDKNFAIGEDQIWLLNVLNNVKTAITVNVDLYSYRIRESSVVHSKKWDNKKMSEIYAREKMVELTESLYPELSKYAHIKYRHCTNSIGLNLLKSKSFKILKNVSSYCKLYFREYITCSSVGIKAKILSLFLQVIYFFLV
ncbi:MAG: glycosyltransferase [Ruminococcus flavefaciens]|nr:glycosyltransferase [Ruminococcus flavefaciens]MCM1362126.1 glycosyltransferase [Clostridiales bacterium]MCM1435427.1 glycosyltransferase [Ruminococcus flavefaciens]